MAKYSDGLKDRIWSEGFLHIFEGGSVMEIFSGAIPSDPNQAVVDPPLIRMMLPNVPFKLASPQVVDVNTTWQSLYGDVMNTGHATWARIRKVSDLNQLDTTRLWPRIDITVGVVPPAELILDSADINSSTIIRINNFLLIADVLLTLPTIAVQPINFNVHAGDEVTFTIVATGLMPIKYQWQTDRGAGWINVGANAPTYTIPAATLTDNLSRFRVLVTNESGSILSDSATVLVS
jgi:hypothetical protein